MSNKTDFDVTAAKIEYADVSNIYYKLQVTVVCHF